MNRRRLLQSGIPEGFVDLGLPSGILWAQGNIVKNGNKYSIGEETDYGTYFSWGNIDGYNEGHSSFDPNSYYSTAGGSVLTNIDPSDAAHDAAFARLGSPWHLPTKENFEELKDYTDEEWTTINGVAGRKFMKKTDHSVYIFLPAAGDYSGTSHFGSGSTGFYWSSSYQSPSRAYYFSVVSSAAGTVYDSRYFGHSVRPVGPVRFTFNSYKIYVTDTNRRPHTSFTPNTDIWVVSHNPEYDNTSYMVVCEFKAGISYPILTQSGTMYYLVDDTNKEIINGASNLVGEYGVYTSVVFPNGYYGQEVIGTFDDGTEVVTDSVNLVEYEDLKINGENAIVSNYNYNYYNYEDIEIGL